MFAEVWTRSSVVEAGLSADFVQLNCTRSAQNVLRGLHYQAGDAAQGKLVWVGTGKIFDVVVDLRRSSPTFGQWEGHFLVPDKLESLWVPPGCAHGFLALSETNEVNYAVTAPYSPQAERTLLWNDPHLGISWPLPPGTQPTISPKDKAGEFFDRCEKYS